MKIEVKMSKEDAQKECDSIAEKIGLVDIAELCDDKGGEDGEKEMHQDEENTHKTWLINAIRCGLVFYDEEKGCLVQKLINSIKVGEIERDALYFKTKITVGEAQKMRTENAIEIMTLMINRMTDCPMAIIKRMSGQDVHIMKACAHFFDK